MSTARKTPRWLRGALALLASMPAVAGAADEQFFFLGRAERLGSLSNEGAGEVGVYLRWDALQGDLPPDVLRLELRRDGAPIATLPAHAPMTAAEIDALYAPATEARRRAGIQTALEALREMDGLNADPKAYDRWLKGGRAGAMPGAPRCPTNQGLGAELRCRLLLPDANGWAQLASRLHFNVARARHRAFLDTAATPGSHTYTLEAVACDDADDTCRASLGGLVVDVPAAPNAASLPAPPANLRQDTAGMPDYDCLAPEEGKVHGVVVLSWKAPGNATDEFVQSVSTAGYDLYRAKGRCPAAVPPGFLRDAWAARRAGDATLPGLVKVTDDPILATGDAPHWIELRPELEADGIRPNDELCYYLAARDFTDNYGLTRAVDVRVPDLLPPPAPTGIEAIPESSQTRDDGGGVGAVRRGFKLRWEHVEPASYVRQHDDGRTWCNADEAARTGRLAYADTPAGCATSDHVTVNLDVARYLVYRFDASDDAARFRDADGDGLDDTAEPGLDAQGRKLACVHGPSPTPPIEVLAATARNLPDGRRVLEATDDTPAANVGKVFWYRVAAVSPDGRVGALSPAVRGLYPDVEMPPYREPEDFGFGLCSLRTDVWESAGWGGAYDLAGRATAVRFTCAGDPWIGEIDPGQLEQEVADPARLMAERIGDEVNRTLVRYPIATIERPKQGPLRAFEFNRSTCADFQRRQREAEQRLEHGCSSVEAVFLGRGDAELARARIEFVNDLCSFQAVLDVDCQERREPLPLGGIVDRPIVIERPADLPDGHCVDARLERDGFSYRLAKICKDDAPLVYQPSKFGIGHVCFSAAVVSATNVSGPETNLGCGTTLPDTPPDPPRLTGIAAAPGGDVATLGWFAPSAGVGGIVAEWYVDGGAGVASGFFSSDGKTGAAAPIASSLRFGAALQVGDTICARAASLAAATGANQGGQLSAWAGPYCVQVKGDGPQPLKEFLPWPNVPRPQDLGPLNAWTSRGRPFVEIGRLDVADAALVVDVGSPVGLVPAVATMLACERYLEPVADRLNFVVYRQARDPATGTLEPFVQITPLLEQPFCHTADTFPGETPRVDVDDPWFTAAFDGAAMDAGLRRLLFVDQFPVSVGTDYRYQLVYFDERGEITGHRTTAWLSTEN